MINLWLVYWGWQVIDKSFGFDTAVEEAQRAINAAHVEAESVHNGVGVVKLMGRYSGILLSIVSQGFFLGDNINFLWVLQLFLLVGINKRVLQSVSNF